MVVWESCFGLRLAAFRHLFMSLNGRRTTILGLLIGHVNGQRCPEYLLGVFGFDYRPAVVGVVVGDVSG